MSWAICKSAPSLQTDNHASTPPLSFLQAGYPSCRQTNSVKALKGEERHSETAIKRHEVLVYPEKMHRHRTNAEWKSMAPTHNESWFITNAATRVYFLALYSLMLFCDDTRACLVSNAPTPAAPSTHKHLHRPTDTCGDIYSLTASNTNITNHSSTLMAIGTFSVAGPMAWNSLPDFVQDPTSSIDCFRHLLKTFMQY